MTKLIAFLVDPLETFEVINDTSLLLMQEVQNMNYQLAVFNSAQLFYESGCVKAQLDFINIDHKKQPWWHTLECKTIDLSQCDAVIIRKDPPFDQEYLYVTYLLELLEKQGVVVSNSARGIRDANEKLFTTHFANLMPDTLVTNQSHLILDFLKKHQRIVIKPLNSMAGRDVILIDVNQSGVKALIHLMTQYNCNKVMAQQFLPDVMQGDKRIQFIAGEPLPLVVSRKPADNDFRANVAAGASTSVIPLSEEDKKLCEQLKPLFVEYQLDFVGIDVIGHHLIEINVTSPGIVELQRDAGFDVAAAWLKMIDERIKNR